MKFRLHIGDKEFSINDALTVTVEAAGKEFTLSGYQIRTLAERTEAVDIDQLILALHNEYPQLSQKVQVVRKGAELREKILLSLNSESVTEDDLKKYSTQLSLYDKLRELDNTLLDQIKNLGGLASVMEEEVMVERGTAQTLLKTKTK